MVLGQETEQEEVTIINTGSLVNLLVPMGDEPPILQIIQMRR